MRNEALILPVLAILGTFGSLIVFIIFHYTNRNRLYRDMLDRGIDPIEFVKANKDKSNNRILKYGFVAAAIGLGVLFANVLDRMGMSSEPAYFSMILLMGGAGLVGFYLITNKNNF